MVTVYNTRSVKNMPEEDRQRIIDVGVPIELYEKGYFTLGPVNKSSVTKCAIIGTLITEHKLPIFPSLFSEMVVDRCFNKTSRLDFRETIDGPPGYGKSISAISDACRYAIEAADRFGQNPKDYFSLDNCALLQDTDGVTHLMDELDKYQAVIVDDAGVAAGNRDFLTQSNKNLDAIMAVCRPKRWNIIFTSPMNKHLDLQLRELTYCRSKVFKSCHEADFNILHHQKVLYRKVKNTMDEMNPHYDYGGQRVEAYISFNPDLFEPYKGIVKKYEDNRDKATDDLIHTKSVEEKLAKNPVDKRDEKFKEYYEKFKEKVYKFTHSPDGKWMEQKSVENRSGDTYSINRIMKETGLTDRMVKKIIFKIKEDGR